MSEPTEKEIEKSINVPGSFIRECRVSTKRRSQGLFPIFFHCQSKLWKQTFPILELRLIEYHCGDSCRISFNGMASCMANLLRFDKN